jgi:TonB-linked SusC/RagA family outer membrane protein
MRCFKQCAIFLIMLYSATAYAAYDRKIQGIVIDENGDPLPGAVVQEYVTDNNASMQAVVCDLNGHFRLTLPTSAKAIVVSYMGYVTKNVPLTKAESYQVQLTPDVKALDEVLVTGYQSISKERATGSFAKFDSETIKNQRINSVSSILEGRIAGMSDGLIRGTTTMNGVTTPLYVIDGFPVEKTTNNGYGTWEESIPDINPEDIESITVLKDAGATSIYGARAANGVVVITTKKAKSNKTEINFSTTLTVQPKSTYKGYLADSETMVGLEKEWASQNPNLSGSGAAAYASNLLTNATYTTPGIQSILKYHAGQISESEMNSALSKYAAAGKQYYDDIDKYGRTAAFYQQYNLSIGKKSEKNNFRASLTYKHDQMSDKYTKDQSIGINLQNTVEINKWLSVDLGTYINYADGTTQSYDLTSPGYSVMPYMSLKNSDGTNYTNYQADRYSQSTVNTINNYGLYNLNITPLDELGMNTTGSKDFSNRSFARLNIKFTDWLRYSASFQYEAGEYKTKQLLDKNSYTVRYKTDCFATSSNGQTTFNIPYGNIYTEATNSSRNYNFRQQLDFNRTFGGKHEVTALVGMEIKENKSNYFSSTLYNYDPSMLSFDLIDQKTLSSFSWGLLGWAGFYSNNANSIYELINRYVSFYGNASYAYDDKYMASASIRWDRTNLFATSSKYQKKPTWSVGAGWRIDKEDFFDSKAVNMLKLRASYGIGGNIAKNSAPYMTAYYSTNTSVGGLQGSISSRPNPNLRWEKTTTANIGVDFALLKNRLSGSFEFYNKKGTDLLANTNGVPTEGWGYSTYTINNGEMTNRGFELTLNGVAISNKDWTWSIGGTLGYNKNKVDYVNVTCPVLYLLFDYASAYPQVGNPYNAIYGFQYAGLNSDGLPQVYDKDGNIYVNTQPSNIEDAIYLGTTVPIYNGSITTNLRFRQWELSAMLLFEGGHKMRNDMLPIISSGMSVANADIANRWQQPGDEAHTSIPRYVSSESSLYSYYLYSNYERSSAAVLDAGNAKLRNISLAYNVPSSVIRKAYLTSLRVMVGMENVATFAKDHNVKRMISGYEKPNYMLNISVGF